MSNFVQIRSPAVPRDASQLNCGGNHTISNMLPSWTAIAAV